MSQRYLYVGRLDKDVTQRDLEELFESYGRFTKCDIRSVDVSIMNKASSCIHDVFITLLDNNDDRDIN